MGSIVAVAAASHAPGILAHRELADPEQAARYYEGMATLARAVRDTSPDVILAVTNDHYVNYYLDNVPAICVGTAPSYRGPVEPFMGEEKEFPGDRPFSKALLAALLEHDFDVSFSEKLVFDHGTVVPLHFINPDNGIPVVPIVVNNIYSPMPSPRRLYQLGRLLPAVIESLPIERRVALVATGGLSHNVGNSRAGDIDTSFDGRFLDAVRRGEGSMLASLSHTELEAAGNGTHEIRNWLCALGAIGDVPAEYVAYEPVAAWATGCGAAVWPMSERG
jgi:aromatic ring-opening dioxygenase catalytic subunit (LigB family)